MKSIASRQNPWFKRVREAILDHAGEIAIEGPKAVRDALAGGWRPIALVARSVGDAIPGFTSETLVFTPELFGSLTETRNSQGIIGLFERPRPGDFFSDRDRLVVALDGVQDPGNVGTIVRLAAAFDCAGVVLLPGCADAYGPKAIRASAGAVLSVPIAAMTADELLARAWPLYAADAGAKPGDPPGGGAVLVFGNEGSGLSPTVAARATGIAIPISPRVESLNVASAAAILLARSYARRGLD